MTATSQAPGARGRSPASWTVGALRRRVARIRTALVGPAVTAPAKGADDLRDHTADGSDHAAYGSCHHRPFSAIRFDTTVRRVSADLHGYMPQPETEAER